MKQTQREIKFRAWNTDKRVRNNKMIYDIQEGVYDENYNYGEGGYVVLFEDYLNDRKYVVMQYTGLRDMNGLEIYEGDIYMDYTSNYPEKFVVEYDEDNGGWSWSYAIDEYCHNPTEDYEVIGNIYENPELLDK